MMKRTKQLFVYTWAWWIMAKLYGNLETRISVFLLVFEGIMKSYIDDIWGGKNIT